ARDRAARDLADGPRFGLRRPRPHRRAFLRLEEVARLGRAHGERDFRLEPQPGAAAAPDPPLPLAAAFDRRLARRQAGSAQRERPLASFPSAGPAACRSPEQTLTLTGILRHLGRALELDACFGKAPELLQ